MVVKKEAREGVSTGVIGPAKIDGLKPNVMGNAIFPQGKGHLTKVPRLSPALVVNIGNSRNVVTPDKERNRRISRKKSPNTKENSLEFQEIDVQPGFSVAPPSLGVGRRMQVSTPTNQAGIRFQNVRRGKGGQRGGRE